MASDLTQGKRLVVAGEYQKALLFLKRAAKNLKHSQEAWLLLGRAQLGLGKAADGQASNERALELAGPLRATAAMNLAACLVALGKTAQALDVYTRLSKMPDASADDVGSSFIGQSNCLVELGDIEAAMVRLDDAMALRPAYVPAWTEKAALLCEGKQWKEALALSARLIRLAPKDADGWLSRGMVLHEAGGKGSEEALSKAAGLGSSRATQLLRNLERKRPLKKTRGLKVPSGTREMLEAQAALLAGQIENLERRASLYLDTVLSNVLKQVRGKRARKALADQVAMVRNSPCVETIRVDPAVIERLEQQVVELGGEAKPGHLVTAMLLMVDLFS